MRKLLVAALVAAFSATLVSQAAAARTIAVGDDYFLRKGDPPTVRVSQGTKVTWRWVGRDMHNVAVTRGPQKFRSSYKRSGTYSKTCTDRRRSADASGSGMAVAPPSTTATSSRSPTRCCVIARMAGAGSTPTTLPCSPTRSSRSAT
jgi:plastocyanin